MATVQMMNEDGMDLAVKTQTQSSKSTTLDHFRSFFFVGTEWIWYQFIWHRFNKHLHFYLFYLFQVKTHGVIWAPQPFWIPSASSWTTAIPASSTMGGTKMTLYIAQALCWHSANNHGCESTIEFRIWCDTLKNSKRISLNNFWGEGLVTYMR